MYLTPINEKGANNMLKDQKNICKQYSSIAENIKTQIMPN